MELRLGDFGLAAKLETVELRKKYAFKIHRRGLEEGCIRGHLYPRLSFEKAWLLHWLLNMTSNNLSIAAQAVFEAHALL